MTILQVYRLKKEYAGLPILTDVTFHLSGGERVGLVGVNGSGKSTLLKILAGELAADGGNLTWVTAGLSRAYLSQDGHWDPELTLGEQIGPVPADLLGRCRVGRSLLAQKAGTLSGGEKTRAALARTLAGCPDLLLLDEPTNHLDAEGLQWLEGLLASYRGTVLVVSHDRYFLDRVTTRTLELAGGVITEYAGNYSAYAAEKQAEWKRQQADYQEYLSARRRLEEAIREQRQRARAGHNVKVERDAPAPAKAFYAKKGRAAARLARSMEKRLENMQVEKPREAFRVSLKLEGGSKTARHLIVAEDLGFTFDGRRWLLRSVNFSVRHGDRVALVGPNGAGKSTLVRLILGELRPKEGAIRVSPVRIAHLAQEMEHLNPGNTVLEEAAGGNSAPDQADTRSLLGCLGFSRDGVLKRVGVLSGGEKVRLALAKILLSDPDLLVLDEPTNGLDLTSREQVEHALETYPGTLVLVSHDRYLLRRTATRVFALDGGRLEAFSGGYEEFLQRGARNAQQTSEDRRLLLETRLAQLSADLAAAREGDAERLNAEFIAISRELWALRGN